MKEIRTVCTRDCYDSCGLIVKIDDSGRIISVRGDADHPITRGLTCPRAANDNERVYKNRVEAPFLRKGNTLTRISWDRALGILSDRIKKVLAIYGPKALLYLAYAGNMGLLSELFPQRLWHALGATQTDYALCSASGHRGLCLHYGHSYGIMPEELLSMDLILFWGFNAAVSAPHIWSLAREAARTRRTGIVVVDPIRTKTAARSDLWIRPRPGTDVALAYGVMNELIRKNRVDHTFIDAWTQGYEDLKREAFKWSPERVESVTGVSRDELEVLAGTYGKAKNAAIMIGIGLQKCVGGADQVRAVSLLPALTGRHRGFFYGNGEAFNVDKAYLKGVRQAGKKGGIVNQVAVADHIGRGEFKFIFVNGMNPAMTLPNQKTFREGLLRDDVFLVVHETHWSKTATLADLVLPAPTFLEKDDVVIPYGHGYAHLTAKALQPVTDSRTETWVMQETARRLDLKEYWVYEDPWSALGKVLHDALENGGYDALLSGKAVRLREKPRDLYGTPSGKIELNASQAIISGRNPLPEQSPLDIPPGEFVYLASATPEYTHTQFQEVYGNIPARVHLHPRDAERLGIQDGDRVLLCNRRGDVSMEAVVSDEVPCGCLWSPRQFEDRNGNPHNVLSDGSPQKIGSGPTFNSTRVTLQRQ